MGGVSFCALFAGVLQLCSSLSNDYVMLTLLFFFEVEMSRGNVVI